MLGIRLARLQQFYSSSIIRLGLARFFLFLPMVTMLTACGDLYLDAPHRSNIHLMEEDAPASVHVEQVVWFKYWGNEPIIESETHAATIIEDRQLKEARIRMVNTPIDILISAFTGPFGFPRRTLIVEGNPMSEQTVPSAVPNNQLSN